VKEYIKDADMIELIKLKIKRGIGAINNNPADKR
jgi:hypothetical protein